MTDRVGRMKWLWLNLLGVGLLLSNCTNHQELNPKNAQRGSEIETSGEIAFAPWLNTHFGKVQETSEGAETRSIVDVTERAADTTYVLPLGRGHEAGLRGSTEGAPEYYLHVEVYSQPETTREEQATTRATLLNTQGLENFGLFAFSYDPSKLSNGETFDTMNPSKAKLFAKNISVRKSNGWKTDKHWAKDVPTHHKARFYAYAPYNASIRDRSTTSGAAPSFSYTVPTDPDQQKDILYAQTDDIYSSRGEAVPLSFKHALATITIKLGQGVPSGTFENVTFSGIHKSGYFGYAKKTSRGTTPAGWMVSDTGSDLVINIPQNKRTHSGGGEHRLIEHYMVMPQKHSSTKTISLKGKLPQFGTPNNDYTFSTSMNGINWEPNKHYVYTITTDKSTETSYTISSSDEALRFVKIGRATTSPTRKREITIDVKKIEKLLVGGNAGRPIETPITYSRNANEAGKYSIAVKVNPKDRPQDWLQVFHKGGNKFDVVVNDVDYDEHRKERKATIIVQVNGTTTTKEIPVTFANPLTPLSYFAETNMMDMQGNFAEDLSHDNLNEFNWEPPYDLPLTNPVLAYGNGMKIKDKIWFLPTIYEWRSIIPVEIYGEAGNSILPFPLGGPNRPYHNKFEKVAVAIGYKEQLSDELVPEHLKNNIQYEGPRTMDRVLVPNKKHARTNFWVSGDIFSDKHNEIYGSLVYQEIGTGAVFHILLKYTMRNYIMNAGETKVEMVPTNRRLYSIGAIRNDPAWNNVSNVEARIFRSAYRPDNHISQYLSATGETMSESDACQDLVEIGHNPMRARILIAAHYGVCWMDWVPTEGLVRLITREL